MSNRNADKNAGGRDTQTLGSETPISRRAWLGIAAGGAAVALGAGAWWRRGSSTAIASNATPILVYASPSCGCCQSWMTHLGDNGFAVRKELVADVTPLKKKYGVPDSLASCHTAVVDGYTIEGHVPADLIRKVLAERPSIAGLAARGMPNGAPGMEGLTKDRYEVIAFTSTGATEVYAVRG
jgi:hypothetical protein